MAHHHGSQPELEFFLPAADAPSQPLPLATERVEAGFPSPARDYVEPPLDLNDLCVRHPAATYFVRVQGDSMIDGHICPEDILVVDRSLEPCHGDIVIACFDGDLTVKRLETRPELRLVPMNPSYQPLVPAEGCDMEIFGVVTTVIHPLRKA